MMNQSNEKMIMKGTIYSKSFGLKDLFFKNNHCDGTILRILSKIECFIAQIN